MIITFCGHRHVSERAEIEKKLFETLKRLADREKNLVFYCGGYGSFDGICSSSIDKLRKNSLCHIEKLFVTPYITQSYADKNESMKKFFDDIIYPPLEDVPYKLAIIKRNEWMVKNADLVIAYVRTSIGGAARTLLYAEKLGKQTIIL